LPPQELHLLENLESVDPFSKLGYHHVTVNKQTSGIIRVFNPQFKKVEVLWEDGSAECEYGSGTGLFECLFPNRLEFFPYRIRATYHSGQATEYDDPYAILPVLSDYDVFLFGKGTHYQVWKKLGANQIRHQGHLGVHFAVWAPNAHGLAVIGDFNGWNGRSHMMRKLSFSGIWEIFIPGLSHGQAYKFLVHTLGGAKVEKMDPYAKEAELRPRTAAIIADPQPYAWTDQAWAGIRPQVQRDNKPISVYEVHLGSWQKNPGRESGFLTYDELAERLIPYATGMGYTHLELMPVQEHPLDESWGYQVIGYYAPTKRFGTPAQFKSFVEKCHQAGLGVILDWVPAHFPSDLHGLDFFDGTSLYAHEDPRKGSHPQWGTRIFNYSRHEVSNFLIANAIYWMEEFHIDGLRVDAVASMLYLDYARENGAWIPNPDGSNTNHEAVEFLKHLNSVVAQHFPHSLMIAEESSAFPGVTHPLDRGGLGFHYKWNLGWMNDFLTYLSKDPLFRRYHQGLLTFEMSYAFSEKFCLVLSHDEVVHGKGSLPNKMPGDDWQKFANVRTAFAYLFAHPGKKLHFMGLEIGQWLEWNPGVSLDWPLLQFERHKGLQTLVRDLNAIYKQEPALYELDSSYAGFQWVDFHDQDNNIVSFLRKGEPREGGGPQELLLCLFNFSPVPRHEYRLGVPLEGFYVEVFNSDSQVYGGGNLGNMGGKRTSPVPMHNLPHSLELTAPPLAACFFKLQPDAPPPPPARGLRYAEIVHNTL
ncbi:MAG TPA: 1,4-alpha-glucan branching protein GlgB, partial [Fibrobacteria bacterium]|nr:1,4-alpha-glucan branching protein GlgB [Fibrobacteria bacterium]